MTLRTVLSIAPLLSLLELSGASFVGNMWRMCCSYRSDDQAFPCGIYHLTGDLLQSIDLHDTSNLRDQPVEESEVTLCDTDNRRECFHIRPVVFGEPYA